MIVQESFLKKLRSAFDLNIYEVKIWTALLSRGIATAGELSDISNVPRSRSYDVLESLEKKGFTILKLGKPIKYIAITPEEVIKRVRKNVKERADAKLKHLGDVKEDKMFRDIELLFKQGIEKIDPESLAGTIKGRENIYDHLDAMLQNAKKSVIIVTTPEGLLRKFDKLKFRLKKLKDKGIKIRIATPFNEEVQKKASEIKQFAELRSINPIRARFALIDGRELMFIATDDKSTHETYDTGIWVNSKFFSQAMETMFNFTWTNANIKK
ncbi:MAG: helix-turn-helix domain-containing protein [Candidatus Woesearchaeota archaeon]